MTRHCSRTDPHRCTLGAHPAPSPEPATGWRALHAYLAGTGPRPFPLPGELRRCDTCHGWHR